MRKHNPNPQGLVLNAGASAQSVYSKLTCNLLPAACRIETLEGREYTVIPMVMLTEGVHNGSQGPLYYPKEELSKTPAVWNHKPIVVYHPTMNGESVSACDPTVINSRKVGIMMNTTFDKGKLKSEAWIEKTRAEVVDPRIMEAVTSNEMMELSTGVFIDVESSPGTWNQETYSGIARNYRPDHLALLPDQIGACSIADGAGLLRNQEKGGNHLVGAFKRFLTNLGMHVSNEMSFDNVRSALAAKLREKYNENSNTGPYVWVSDVYSNFVVYEWDGKLYRLGYTSNDTEVVLSTETPVEVERVTEYRTVNGAFVGNRNRSTNNTNQMNKKEAVDAIIAANTGWKESDREALMAMNEAHLTLIRNNVSKQEKTPAPAPAAPAAPAAAPAPAAPAANSGATAPAPKAPASVEEYVSSAPKEVQDVLRNSLSVYAEEKNKIVEAISANKNNAYTKEELGAMPLGELRKLARLAGATTPSAPAPDYSGQAPVPGTNTKSEEEVLPLPAMNFEAAK